MARTAPAHAAAIRAHSPHARLWSIFVLLAASGPGLAVAAPTACPEHFFDGQAADIKNPKLLDKARPLCFSAFAVLHSGVTRTPLYAAERLTRARVEAARPLERVNSFHEEPRLPPDERADLSDYARSGYDRGHMAPAGDMPDPIALAESFSLANIVPQNPDDNRNLWGSIESAVRDLALKEGDLYVVTGPLFEGDHLDALKGRVLVPTRIYKAVYSVKRAQAGAYVADNAEGWAWRAVSIAELNALAGLDLFPSLPASVKAVAMVLPEPHRGSGREQAGLPDGKRGPGWSENIGHGPRHAGRGDHHADQTGSLGADLGKRLGRFVRDLLEGRLFQR